MHASDNKPVCCRKAQRNASQPAALWSSLSEMHFPRYGAKGDDKKFKTVSERKTKKYGEANTIGRRGKGYKEKETEGDRCNVGNRVRCLEERERD